MLRLYEGLWIQLKRDRQVSIKSNSCFHSRVIKGIIKEKYKETLQRKKVGLPVLGKLEITHGEVTLTFRLVKFSSLLTPADL
jgi:hypothetical protein